MISLFDGMVITDQPWHSCDIHGMQYLQFCLAIAKLDNTVFLYLTHFYLITVFLYLTCFDLILIQFKRNSFFKFHSFIKVLQIQVSLKS